MNCLKHANPGTAPRSKYPLGIRDSLPTKQALNGPVLRVALLRHLSFITAAP